MNLFENNQYLKDSLPEMLKSLLRPGNIISSLKLLNQNSDFIWSLAGDNSNDFIYGFPAIDGPSGGMKIATETFANQVTADSVDRNVSADEINQHSESVIDMAIESGYKYCDRLHIRVWDNKRGV